MTPDMTRYLKAKEIYLYRYLPLTDPRETTHFTIRLLLTNPHPVMQSVIRWVLLPHLNRFQQIVSRSFKIEEHFFVCKFDLYQSSNLTSIVSRTASIIKLDVIEKNELWIRISHPINPPESLKGPVNIKIQTFS